jgi:transcriptional regulator with XRE-family HTH domain
MDILQLVGHNLRNARLKKGVSQETLANDAGVAMNYVSCIERGVQNPTVMMLHRLAQVLGIAESQFFAPVPDHDTLARNLKAGRKRQSSKRQASGGPS